MPVRLLKIIGTFHLVCLTWLLFRATTIEQAWHMISRLTNDWRWTAFATQSLGMVALLAVPLLIYEAWVERRSNLLALTRTSWMARAFVYLVIVIALVCLAPERSSEFIYFQF